MDIQTILSALVTFVGTTLVYFLMGIAFLIFIWNMFRYFIMEGASEEGRKQAKSLAIWGILGFVVIGSIWGIVNFIRNNLNINNNTPITPDYMQERSTYEDSNVEPADIGNTA